MRGDYRIEDDREPEPGCERHRGEPASGCACCAEEREAECDTCGGSRLVTVSVAAYSISWTCHCDDEARDSRPPIAAE